MSETFHCETTGLAANQMRLRRNISENLFIFVDGPAASLPRHRYSLPVCECSDNANGRLNASLCLEVCLGIVLCCVDNMF